MNLRMTWVLKYGGSTAYSYPMLKGETMADAIRRMGAKTGVACALSAKETTCVLLSLDVDEPSFIHDYGPAPNPYAPDMPGHCADCGTKDRPLHPWQGDGEMLCEPCDIGRRDFYREVYGHE